MKFTAAFLFLLLIVTCTTYDSAIIYHKNFKPGTHALLRFDGYYDDTTVNSQKDEYAPSVKPVFFYSEGSSFSTNNRVAASTLPQLIKTNRLFGSWGNYLVKGDSITLEKFQLIKSNYVRIILKGFISEKQIHWTSRKEHNETFKPVNYSIYFQPFSSKPDSLRNFTRTKEKYNQ
jgi:hypothetical protein